MILLTEIPMSASKVAFFLISRYPKNITSNHKVFWYTHIQNKGKDMVQRGKSKLVSSFYQKSLISYQVTTNVFVYYGR